ncbi:MAG TPA: cytidine deaminase [Candidatus Saccharimonadales bacterium]|nr:cytidine deaminase [Candidatus Saccharimonadales bacterium]
MFKLTEQQTKQLLQSAGLAMERAYAPFSKFHVGAAILTQSGEIFTGCNVENSSFGLTNCAERTAIFTAVAAGALNAERELLAVAVVNREGVPCSPCGACRQVIFEFGPEAVVIYRASSGEMAQTLAKDLLPEGFRLR